MIEIALGVARQVTGSIAVNVHSSAFALQDYLGNRVHLSVEHGERLGTAGGVARLRDWIGSRDVVVINSDLYLSGSIRSFVQRWRRDRVTLLVSPDCQRPDFSGLWRFAGVSLLPNRDVAMLSAVPSGLYEVLWGRRDEAGALDLVPFLGVSIDCGTLPDYLLANLVAAQSRLVVGAGAECRGHAIDTVLWDGCQVEPDERLVRCIRATNEMTVHVE